MQLFLLLARNAPLSGDCGPQAQDCARASRVMDTREFLIEFELRNACVTVFNDHFTKFRTSFTSLHEGVNAMVHGFTEYTQGYQRLTSIKSASDEERARLLATCDRRPIAIGIPFSCNNVYHQAFHAVPAWERWRSLVAARAAMAVGPSWAHAQQSLQGAMPAAAAPGTPSPLMRAGRGRRRSRLPLPQPGAPLAGEHAVGRDAEQAVWDYDGDDRGIDYLPLIYPSAAVGKKMSADPLKWHACVTARRLDPTPPSMYLSMRCSTAPKVLPGYRWSACHPCCACATLTQNSRPHTSLTARMGP